MPARKGNDITGMLLAWREGDSAALDRLMPLVHDELRRQARVCLRRERAGHTLQSSDLLNEAYLRLVDARRVDWRSRAHFFGATIGTMRRILVDRARRRAAAKRGCGDRRVSFDEVPPANDNPERVIAVHEALRRLATVAPRRARIVELQFFGGLNQDEVAEVVAVSKETVVREWRAAKAWLYRDMLGHAHDRP
jgi:RNA polymerase sigma-70 factor (ECF subfamily)